MRLAREMGCSEGDLEHVRRGALLHDIGKLGIPDRILHKPGPLSGIELEIMRMHPTYAREMLARIPYLHPALDIPYCHHERWDGMGYPQGEGRVDPAVGPHLCCCRRLGRAKFRPTLPQSLAQR